MKKHNVEVVLNAIITVEAKNQREDKEEAAKIALGGYFENGAELVKVKIIKD